MYRSLAEAAANCTRNIATGYGPIFSDRKSGGIAALLTRESNPEIQITAGGETHGQVAQLIARLQDADCGVRVSAVCTLAQFGPESSEAVPALIEVLDDRDWVVRVAAITALGEIGQAASSAIPHLIEALAKDDVCASATIALGRIGPSAQAAVEAITVLRRNRSGFIRWCAEEALRSITG